MCKFAASVAAYGWVLAYLRANGGRMLKNAYYLGVVLHGLFKASVCYPVITFLQRITIFGLLIPYASINSSSLFAASFLTKPLRLASCPKKKKMQDQLPLPLLRPP